MRGFHIGLDLDNTIISYDDAFGAVGVEIGLLPRALKLAGKDEVKSFLITPARGEQDWMRLQGQVYGRYIDRASLCEGVAEFLRTVRERGARVSIISHKTRYGHFDETRINLWDAASGFLDRHGFFSPDGFALDRNDLHFLETRDEKVAKIAAAGCQAFVDDLPEVLLHPAFPNETLPIWLAGNGASAATGALVAYRDWTEIRRALEKLASTA
jgi:hypothetical protein